ncbi:cation transporting ATPase C-terminal domain-containing protein, partial [Lactiplantibacillus pentosus]
FFVTALGTSWLVLLSAIYVPPFARIFHTAPLTFMQWVPVLFVAGTVSQISKPIINYIFNWLQDLGVCQQIKVRRHGKIAPSVYILTIHN